MYDYDKKRVGSSEKVDMEGEKGGMYMKKSECCEKENSWW